jgi:hypothetical protein
VDDVTVHHETRAGDPFFAFGDPLARRVALAMAAAAPATSPWYSSDNRNGRAWGHGLLFRVRSIAQYLISGIGREFV